MHHRQPVIRVSFRDLRIHIEVVGEIDVGSAPALVRLVRAALSAAPGPPTMDLSQVSFIGSAGLRALRECRRTVEEAGRCFRLGPVSPVVQRLLDISGVGAELRSRGPSAPAASEWVDGPAEMHDLGLSARRTA
jgi:anti-anti-sigma factor